MDGESLLNAYAVRNSSYSKGLGDSAAMLCNNGSLKELDSFLFTFGDADVNLYTVTNAKLRYVSFELLINKSLDLFHLLMSSSKLRFLSLASVTV